MRSQLIACLALPFATFACSSSDDEGDSGSGRGDDPSGSGTGASGGDILFPGTGGATGGGGTGTGGDGLGGTLTRRQIGNTDCVAEVSRGELLPIDIYIMFDMSCSMGCSPDKAGPGQCCNDPNKRIDSVRNALDSFLRSGETAGISIGIGYFGHLALGETSCDPAAYSVPAVDFGPLPGHADPIMNSLNAQIPTGETPTGAALRGACLTSRARKQANPANVVVNLLVTDGIPETPLSSAPPAFLGPAPVCPGGASIQDAQAAASECTSTVPQIPTFVLGVGQALNELNMIAQGGATQQAHLVTAGDPAIVAQDVLNALNSIRDSAAVPCEFQIPPAPAGEVIDTNSVNVEFVDGAGNPTIVYFVDNPGACDPSAGGWHYDNPSAPTTIHLCPSTCNVVETTQGGQVDIALGCGTITPPA